MVKGEPGVSLISRTGKFGASSAAALAVILLGVLPVASGCGWKCGQSPVDPRLRDAPTFVAEGRLLGLTPAQLRSQLGPASDRRIGNWDVAYYAGPDSACIDSRWLVLNLDDTGRAYVARVVTD